LSLKNDNDDVTTNNNDAEKKLDSSTTNNNNKRATFFGLEPRELPSSSDDNTPMLLSVDNGLQFTGPIVMILSIYFTLALFFGDVDDVVGENSSVSRNNNNGIVGGDTSVTTSSTDPNVSNGYVRTWAESSSINGYF
jgi:hypothetical protein